MQGLDCVAGAVQRSNSRFCLLQNLLCAIVGRGGSICQPFDVINGKLIKRTNGNHESGKATRETMPRFNLVSVNSSFHELRLEIMSMAIMVEGTIVRIARLTCSIFEQYQYLSIRKEFRYVISKPSFSVFSKRTFKI